MKVGTHDLCTNMQKNYGTYILNFDFKIFGDFFKF